MNNFFVTKALQYLTGLTKFLQLEGSSTALSNGAWVTIYDESDTDGFMKFSAFAITLDVTSGALNTPVMRILAAPKSATLDVTENSTHKIFPFNSSMAVQSGRNYNLKEELNIPTDHQYAVQVKANLTGTTPAATATLDYVSVVKTNVVDLA